MHSSSFLFSPFISDPRKTTQAGSSGRESERALAAPWPCLLGAGSPCRPQLSHWRCGRSDRQKPGAAFVSPTATKRWLSHAAAAEATPAREAERNLGLSSAPRRPILIRSLSAVEVTTCVHHPFALQRFRFRASTGQRKSDAKIDRLRLFALASRCRNGRQVEIIRLHGEAPAARCISSDEAGMFSILK
jgi:hypothetical protein